MKRWRKKKDEDEDDILSFEDLEEEEDDDEKPRRKRYLPPRPIRTHYSYDDSDDEDEDDGESGPTFDELEPKIRAGKYKPKPDDPWNAHVLYQTLKKLGDI